MASPELATRVVVRSRLVITLPVDELNWSETVRVGYYCHMLPSSSSIVHTVLDRELGGFMILWAFKYILCSWVEFTLNSINF